MQRKSLQKRQRRGAEEEEEEEEDALIAVNNERTLVLCYAWVCSRGSGPGGCFCEAAQWWKGVPDAPGLRQAAAQPEVQAAGATPDPTAQIIIQISDSEWDSCEYSKEMPVWEHFRGLNEEKQIFRFDSGLEMLIKLK